MPLYHCFGLVCGVLSMLSHGGTCVFPSYTFEARPALETVQNEKYENLDSLREKTCNTVFQFTSEIYIRPPHFS